jgi:hypothetical protein
MHAVEPNFLGLKPCRADSDLGSDAAFKVKKI